MSQTPVPDVQALLDSLASQPEMHFRDMTPQQARAAVSEIIVTLDAPREASVQATDYQCPR